MQKQEEVREARLACRLVTKNENRRLVSRHFTRQPRGRRGLPDFRVDLDGGAINGWLVDYLGKGPPYYRLETEGRIGAGLKKRISGRTFWGVVLGPSGSLYLCEQNGWARCHMIWDVDSDVLIWSFEDELFFQGFRGKTGQLLLSRLNDVWVVADPEHHIIRRVADGGRGFADVEGRWLLMLRHSELELVDLERGVSLDRWSSQKLKRKTQPGPKQIYPVGFDSDEPCLYLMMLRSNLLDRKLMLGYETLAMSVITSAL